MLQPYTLVTCSEERQSCISDFVRSLRVLLLWLFLQVAEMKLRLEGRRQDLVDLRNGYDSDDETHYVVDSRTGEIVLSVNEVIQ